MLQLARCCIKKPQIYSIPGGIVILENLYISYHLQSICSMPLILVTGLPSSGKTKLSERISSYFKTKLEQEGCTRQVKIISDSDNLDWDGRNIIYMSIPKEKELRGWLRSEVQRYINLNNIVILDAAAYIKGFRYELHCLSKEAKTQYCVVERLIDPEICWTWNEDSLRDKETDPDLPEPGYTRKTFDALVMRYERCDENNRWDAPLFRLTSEADELNLEELYNIIIKEEPLAPNKCTSLSSTTTTIFKP